MAHNAWVDVPEATQSCRVENLTSNWVVVAHAGERQKPADLKTSLEKVSDSQGNSDKTCLEKPNKQNSILKL